MINRTMVFLALLSLSVVAPAVAAEKAPPAPSPKDKCPVCGMFVAPYPNWLGGIVYKDGGRFFFDGPEDLFTSTFTTRPFERTSTLSTTSPWYPFSRASCG